MMVPRMEHGTICFEENGIERYGRDRIERSISREISKFSLVRIPPNFSIVEKFFPTRDVEASRGQ